MSKQDKSASPVVGSRQWIESFPPGVYDDARDITLQSVEKVQRLDPINRKLIWDDGQELSVDESVQRIGVGYADVPVQLIRVHLVGWLEMGELPDGDLPEDEMDELVTAWADEIRGKG